MNRYLVEFSVVDHFADDAGQLQYVESTCVLADSVEDAMQKFCAEMAEQDVRYVLHDVYEG